MKKITANKQEDINLLYDDVGKKVSRGKYEKYIFASLPRNILGVIVISLILVMYMVSEMAIISYDIATLSVFALGAIKIVPHLQSLFQSFANLRFGLASAESVTKLSEMNKVQSELPIRKKIDLEVRVIVDKVTYGQNVLLCDFDVLLQPGATYFIVGPSGSGKTSLLRKLALITKETNATYFNKMEQFSPRLIYQSHEASLLPMTLENNLTWLSAKIVPSIRLSEMKQKYLLLDRLINTPSQQDIKKDDFSAGQLQRLEIIQTLLSDADLLLFDEPTSNLDNDTARVILRNIIEFNKDEKTVAIIVTHDLDVLQDYSEMKTLYESQNGLKFCKTI